MLWDYIKIIYCLKMSKKNIYPLYNPKWSVKTYFVSYLCLI